MIPGYDRPARIEAHTLVDDVSDAEILPRHLILPGELDAHRLANRLRQKRRIVRNRVRAIDTVAAGAHSEPDAHVLGPQAENLGDGVFERVHRLGRRPDCGFVALHLRNGAGGAERSVHLIWIVVRGFHDLRGARELRIDIV